MNIPKEKRFSELQLLLRHPFPEDGEHVLIDVGAHIGGFSKPFAEKGWQVLAFEPEPENFQELKSALQPFSQAICIPKAVSDRAQKSVPFHLSKEHWGIHSLAPFHSTHTVTINVETVTLNEVLQNYNINKTNLVKIDTEGADYFVLKGLDLETYKPSVVMCEFMDGRTVPHFGYNHHQMVFHMKEHGYTSFVSEWAPFETYGIKGSKNNPHRFIQCVPYPLDHDPAWGNLIFVPFSQANQFNKFINT